MNNETLSELVKLELEEHGMRMCGLFDEAAAMQSLARAVRLGQLSLAQLYSSRWRLFGGRQFD